YQVRAVAVTNNVTINGGYTADGHGIEYFEYESSSSPVYVQTIYGANLKNKLERDTLTISQQALDEDQKKQVRRNIGAPGADEVLGGSDPLCFWKAYSTISTISVNSNAEKTLTVANFGITPIEGYTPMGIFAYTSGKSGLLVRRIDRLNDASSTAGLMVVRNVTGSTISSVTPSITVLYIKSDIVTTAPEEVTA
ncbi:MAG: hypothetical protein J6Y48_11810, partial [Clostridia bacterium]|nr:hypothetical protein [Clostridia bacterium]